MVQPDIIVRKATLDDLKYTRNVSDMVNHAYQSKTTKSKEIEKVPASSNTKLYIRWLDF
jgi:hypothetical protein